MGAPSFLVAVYSISSGTMASIAATSITLTASSHNSASTKAPIIFSLLPILQSAYNDNVHFAFSSAYSLDPASDVVSDDELCKDSDSEDNEGWFYPMQNPPSA